MPYNKSTYDIECDEGKSTPFVPYRESQLAEMRQVCSGGTWFWSGVPERKVRVRRGCPLQQRALLGAWNEVPALPE